MAGTDKIFPTAESQTSKNISLEASTLSNTLHFLVEAPQPRISAAPPPATDRLHPVEISQSAASPIPFKAAAEEEWKELKKESLPFLKIGGEVAKGAIDELVHHPLPVAAYAAEGAVIGAGITFLAPEVAMALGATAMVYAGCKVGQNLNAWLHDCHVEANPQRYSNAENANANRDLQQIGASAMDISAGVGAGLGSGWVVGATRSLLGEEMTVSSRFISNERLYPAVTKIVTAIAAVPPSDKPH